MDAGMTLWGGERLRTTRVIPAQAGTQSSLPKHAVDFSRLVDAYSD